MERPELEPAVLVASLLEHASRPLHVRVLAGAAASARSSSGSRERFPQVAFSWVPLAGSSAASARLLLPDLLPDVGRVVLLPVPAVATADVAELADLDLGAHAIAAPTRGAQGRERLRDHPLRRATAGGSRRPAAELRRIATRATPSTSTPSRAT